MKHFYFSICLNYPAAFVSRGSLVTPGGVIRTGYKQVGKVISIGLVGKAGVVQTKPNTLTNHSPSFPNEGVVGLSFPNVNYILLFAFLIVTND